MQFSTVSILLLFFRKGFSAFSSADCGKSKHCFTLPDQCDPTSATCVFFSWIWNGASFEMELSGSSGAGNAYSAVAFGQVNRMQDADLYYCTGDALESGAITTHHDRPDKLDVAAEPGISVISAETSNGIAKCKFTRAASITKSISSGSKNFDLTSGQYYILAAYGSISSGVIQKHPYGAREISDRTFEMASTFSTIRPTTMESTTSMSESSTMLPTQTTLNNETSTLQTTLTTTLSSEEESKDENLTTNTDSNTTQTYEENTESSEATSDTCRSPKKCFRLPEGCSQTSSDCTFFSWLYDEEAKTFDMEISGGTGVGGIYSGGEGTYAAVAFAETQEMENADLYYCTGSSLESGVITTRHSVPTKLDISTESGITNVKAATTNGVAKCSFTRVASITKAINNSPKEFNLVSNKYYILLARGAMSGESLTRHSSTNRIASPNQEFGSSAMDSHKAGPARLFLMVVMILLSSLKIQLF